MRRIYTILLITIFPSLSTFSQSTDFGGILGVDVEKKLGRNFEISFGEEIRFVNSFTRYDRFKSAVNADCFFLNKQLKTGLSVEYINKMNDERIFLNRYRISAVIGYYGKIKQFRINYRIKYENTFKDAMRGDFRINPEMYLRNRLEIGYSILNKPVKISLSGEFFWRVNNPEHNIIDNIRTVLAVDYRLSKQHALVFFIRADNEIQVSNPENTYYLGIAYKLQP